MSTITNPVPGQPFAISFPQLHENAVVQTPADTAATDRPEPLDMHDWDTAYAIPITTVNAAIIKKKSSPAGFSIAPTATRPVNMSGTFAPWQITTGGDGRLIFMRVVVTTGTATILPSPVFAGSGPFILDGTTIDVLIDLKYRPQPGQPADTGDAKTPTTQDLVASVPLEGASIQKFTPGPNYNPGPDGDFMITPAIKGMFGAWFTANLESFNHVFAVADINATADVAAFQWLKPTATGYAYGEDDDGVPVLGVLSMTGRDGPDRARKAEHLIETKAVPTGAPSGFLISPWQFLKNMVLPGLTLTGVPDHSPWGSPDDFELTNAGMSIRNKNAIASNFHVDGYGNYTGKMEPGAFTITLEAAELKIDIPKMSVEISPGITCEIDYHERLKVVLKDNGNGGKTFWLDEAAPPTVSHQVVFAPWVEALEISADVVSGIILGALGIRGANTLVARGMTVLRARIIAFVIFAVSTAIAILVTKIPQFIGLSAEHNFDNLPDFGDLALKGVDTIQWPGATGYALLSAELDGALKLGIDPKFALAVDATPPPAPKGLRVVA